MERKLLTPAAYAIALVCFVLPFVKISCQGRTLASLTGVRVATGTSVKEPQMFGPVKEKRIPADIVALLALGAGLVGLVLALRGNSPATGIVGFVGALLLLIFKSRTDDAVVREGGGMLQVEYGLGFWGATLLYAAAGILAFVFRSAAAPPVDAGPGAPIRKGP